LLQIGGRCLSNLLVLLFLIDPFVGALSSIALSSLIVDLNGTSISASSS